MNNKEWKNWVLWFSFAVAIIIVYKTIDSVSSIFNAITGFLNLITPFLLAILMAKSTALSAELEPSLAINIFLNILSF